MSSKKDFTQGPQVTSFDHIKFWVGNAKQACFWYCARFGFTPFAYRGLETGNREVVSYAVRQNQTVLVLETALSSDNKDFGAHLTKHGDGVKDVAFTVQDLDSVVKWAKQKGAVVVRDIWEESDAQGKVRMATIQTYGDTTHTLIERKQYQGVFLPGYKIASQDMGEFLITLPNPQLLNFDHVVGNQPELSLDDVSNWYENVLSMHRFWSIDNETNGQPLSMSWFRSVIYSNADECIRLTINEPVFKGERGHNKIQEFVDHYAGPGVQHIAFYSDDVISTAKALKCRGVEFVKVPQTYYKLLEDKLRASNVDFLNDLTEIKKHDIMVDFDANGYILQFFTKPMADRLTLIIEVIHRNNHTGFGFGNFKLLFEALEAEKQ